MNEEVKEKEDRNKKYEVIMQDEWNNLYLMGFYDDLSEAIPDINEWLSIYDVKIDKLEEHASTFNSAFDLDIGMMYEDRDDLIGIMVRGFIFE